LSSKRARRSARVRPRWRPAPERPRVHLQGTPAPKGPISRSIGVYSYVPHPNEQCAAALELLTDRREGAQMASGGLCLLRSELVVAQFGKAFRGRFFCNPARALERPGSPVGSERGDLEAEIRRGRGVGTLAYPDQFAAGTEEGRTGLENRDIL